MTISKALTIAGSDSGGGAGIQADLKTFQELSVYGMSALTAVTAQNTLGVQGVFPLTLEAITQQLDSIGIDLKPEAVKTGMLFNSDIICIVAEKIQQYDWHNLVVDPVMVAKGGSTLLRQEAVHSLISHLLPLALVTTPNIPEAEMITNRSITTIEERKEAAKIIHSMGSDYVVLKGGHDTSTTAVVDLLYDGQEFIYMESTRIQTKHTHGTGCTYSAAITAELAKGKSVAEAIQTAKAFIQAAIEDELGIGAGHGPTNHFAYQNRLRGMNLEANRQ
ncbi:bifunctional hydroxymethylpyrimidine kinase/phosphomethylpyrimidine kinase [Paenibacillus sp. VTT E-133280]|uniref:bifunctional hydroxymethylpyrimidine kinase/phosphomethylpyrimidine kinase n=1 Tax=unclassified Paenibacillus TaxID=185978 RepID=UPI000BA10409|nr:MULTISPECIES: bifunctional hydroxymethylpyrimidine kinase/phosphomethylpyrimidine kinase [unclassified Paenibacillus]MDH6368312.1 hydroxymethylpyrimidine/phosphomethylpyrimidine kinase [Paenibacillus sp. PastF-3]OZQ70156.1 bifunctional hydroxymethylpyrimidine kinase/phosphomethylpyrimidine kinase [Paenibacillus sp. VTT E-133280]OZQ87938.1 bifunctional hydroxymethylpyrimidine kinase/phosphomethylpyrimidine kinase [Paenibacillus sp. VTT E-133291]